MSLLQAQGRARQQRALQTLDDILTEEGGVRLPPLRWVVEPNSSLSGHVPPLGSEEEIRALFDTWTDLLGSRRLAEFAQTDRRILRSISPRFGFFLVYVTITATIPDVLSLEEQPETVEATSLVPLLLNA